MNRLSANLLLDAAKEGVDVPREMVTAALVATGDLDGPSVPVASFLNRSGRVMRGAEGVTTAQEVMPWLA